MSVKVLEYRPAGYGYLIEMMGLRVMPHWHGSFVSSSGSRKLKIQDNYIEEIYPARYWPGDGAGEHLEFALKHNGVNLGLLAEIFDNISKDELAGYIRAKPTGKYTRRLWFFYEFLTGVKLPVDDLKSGNYVDALDTKRYYTIENGERSLRHQILHNILSLRDLVPRGLMFPVSAVMLKNTMNYDDSLEVFSSTFLSLIDYSLDDMGQMTVENDSSYLYQYMDMTAQSEVLYEFVRKTIEEELVEELNFLADYYDTRKAIQNIIDMPDRLIDLFISLCLRNNGSLSVNKRESHFDFLTDDELSAMEKAVKEVYSSSVLN